jgi:hypothetical protein
VTWEEADRQVSVDPPPRFSGVNRFALPDLRGPDDSQSTPQSPYSTTFFPETPTLTTRGSRNNPEGIGEPTSSRSLPLSPGYSDLEAEETVRITGFFL